MALNKGMYKFLAVTSFVVCAMFVAFSFVLYRTGGNYLAAVVVSALEATAGVYLLQRSRE